MIHLLSALIVGSIYGGAYSLRGNAVRIYRLSVILLVALLGLLLPSIIWENQLIEFDGGNWWGTISYARDVLLYSLWLQSLICTTLSVVGLVNQRQRRYLAGACVFCVIFLVSCWWFMPGAPPRRSVRRAAPGPPGAEARRGSPR